ncbi:MAG: hypothetical protein QM662_17000, partial [Gordonia sp. (in: high G+C Gram-positive bacteria)]
MAVQWPLVGRAEELQVVGDSLLGAAGIVVSGPAGVGKTRLALAAVNRSARPCHRLFATATARTIPFGVLAEFAGALGPDPLRHVEEMAAALTASGGGTVVSVDDAHLLDEQSALVVHQLVASEAASVLLTVRSGDRMPEPIRALCADGALARLQLQPLSSGDVTELLEHALGGPVERASAERLWRYTQGNVLYLRQLVDDEIARGQIRQLFGVWTWAGTPEVSPALGELIGANIGRQPPGVIDVVDLVAIGEQVERVALESMAEAAAIGEAEHRGLIVVDPGTHLARPAHPMIGEARRSSMTMLRRARLARGLAAAIAEHCGPSAQHTLQRAFLLAEHGSPGDAPLFTEAAGIALGLLDAGSAADFGRLAIGVGGGLDAKLIYALALITLGDQRGGDAVIGELLDDPQFADSHSYLALLRAANLCWNLGSVDAAERILDAHEEAGRADGLGDSYRGLRASVTAAAGAGPDVAGVLGGTDDLAGALPAAAMMGVWGLAIAAGDVGDDAALRAVASYGYELAGRAPDAANLRFGLGMFHVDSLVCLGAVDEAVAQAQRLHAQVRDVRLATLQTMLIVGIADLGVGDIVSAQRHFRDGMANADLIEEPLLGQFFGFWLAQALAMSGEHELAPELAKQSLAVTPAGHGAWEPHQRLAWAWVQSCADAQVSAQGTALDAARQARRQRRTAREVLCLQTALQFDVLSARRSGVAAHARRLARLAETVDGPRAPAA